MLNALGLGFLFKAKDETSEVIERLKGGFEGLEKAGEKAHHSLTSAVGTGLKTVAGTAVAVGAIAAAGAFEFAEHAEKFSSAIRMAGVASHATAEQMEMLEQLAMAKSLDSMRGSAIGTAEALRELALEGFDAEDAASALDGTLQLMKISMGALDAKGAAGIVNDTLGQFGLRASQASELTDKLAFAIKNFGFRAEELGGAMSGIASGAQLVGATLDDSLIGVGLIKSVFPSATKAAGAFNAAMQQLASSRAQKELGLIGVTVTDVTGKIRPLVDIMGQLAARTAGMSQAMIAHKLEAIAGGRAAGGLSAIIDGLSKGVHDASGTLLTGSAAIGYLRQEMSNTAGTAKKMAEILGDDMGGALKALKNAVSNAGVAFGGAFEGPFKHGIQMANLFIRGMTQLFTQGGFSGEVKEALDKHLGIKDFVVGAFIWIKRLQNYLASWGDGFRQAFAPFQPVLDALVDSFGQLGQALGLTSQTAGQNASTWDTLASIGRSVGEIWGNVAGAVMPVVVGAIQLVTAAVQELSSAWDAIKPAVMSVYAVLKGAFELIGGLFTGNWDLMWGGFVDTVVSASQLVINAVFAMVARVTHLIDQMASAFGADLGLTSKLQDFQASLNAGVNSGTMVLKSVVSSPGASAPGVAHVAALSQAQSNWGKPPKDAEPTFLHANIALYVDGEKLVDAHTRAKREANARAFIPVAAHGGGGF